MRASLPASVLRRHAPLSTKDHQAIAALRKHSDVVISDLRTTIGRDVHLPRNPVVQELLQQLEASQVLLVVGPAGSGKSAIAKEVAGLLGTDHYVFAFRAEELARAHFDETLNLAQVALGTSDLGAVLAAQPRKILIIESVERLLEASTRNAFSDLLALVRSDPTWRLILTCRDYSIDLLCAALLQSTDTVTGILQVPPLSDAELLQVVAQVPAIGPLLTNDRLRALLRNPYTLDMAVRIDWPAAERLPESEREFRTHFWRFIIRAEHHLERGMPQRRADGFMEICARRARALTVYASVVGLDPEVVTSLQNDGLIVIGAEHRELAAPKHDVLEDWGVIEWISQRYVEVDGAAQSFAAALGSCPAIRRMFRTWIAEFAERDPASAYALFDRVIDSEALPLHFRDDAVVAFLKSGKAHDVMRRHSAKLFANDRQLLRRVIHLLRVGCVSLPTWVPTQHGSTSVLFRPDGSAWPAVLTLVQEHLDSFDARENDLLLGLVEDWAKGVWWKDPYPPGTKRPRRSRSAWCRSSITTRPRIN